eukprot:scaffold56364_cov52-Attheya_sp.AAC.1
MNDENLLAVFNDMVLLAQGPTYEASIPWFRTGFTWMYDGGDKDKYTLLVIGVDDKFIKELIFLGKFIINKGKHPGASRPSINITHSDAPLHGNGCL